MKRALLIVDPQVGFSEKGELPVAGASQIMPLVCELAKKFGKADIVAVSRDMHSPDHCSFKENGGLWPVHCVAGTESAEFISGLALAFVDVIVNKAEHEEAYSAFDEYAELEDPVDGSVLIESLEEFLADEGIDTVYVCGLATDYCVKATALDAARLCFKVYVVYDACRAVALDTEAVAIKEMKAAGVEFINSDEIE
jgi:nicotinamidase/pyrazinamidase